MNSIGPSTEPCGTPWLTLVYMEDSSLWCKVSPQSVITVCLNNQLTNHCFNLSGDQSSGFAARLRQREIHVLVDKGACASLCVLSLSIKYSDINRMALNTFNTPKTLLTLRLLDLLSWKKLCFALDNSHLSAAVSVKQHPHRISFPPLEFYQEFYAHFFCSRTGTKTL